MFYFYFEQKAMLKLNLFLKNLFPKHLMPIFVIFYKNYYFDVVSLYVHRSYHNNLGPVVQVDEIRLYGISLYKS